MNKFISHFYCLFHLLLHFANFNHYLIKFQRHYFHMVFLLQFFFFVFVVALKNQNFFIHSSLNSKVDTFEHELIIKWIVIWMMLRVITFITPFGIISKFRPLFFWFFSIISIVFQLYLFEGWMNFLTLTLTPYPGSFTWSNQFSTGLLVKF